MNTFLFLSNRFKACTMLAVFLLVLFQDLSVQAQALPVQPVANFVINRAVGTIITRAAAVRGFAANDPRIATTLASVGEGLTAVNTVSTVAGVGLAIAGAPMWLGIAASLGVLAVGAAIVAGNSSISLDTRHITIQQQVPKGVAYAPYSGVVDQGDGWARAAAEGIPIYRTSSCVTANPWCSSFPAEPSGSVRNVVFSAGSVVLVGRTLADLDRLENIVPQVNYPQFGEHWSSTNYFVLNLDGNDYELWRRVTGEEYTCVSSVCSLKSFSRSAIRYGIIIGAGVKPLSSSQINTIYPQIQPATANEVLSPDTLAKIADVAWRNAASKAGYQGLPYSLTQPITAAEVQPWVEASPQSVPKISDLLTPANNPQSSSVVISPTVTTATTPVVPVVPVVTPPVVDPVTTPNVKVDLGPDPGVSSPTLSAPDWFTPLLNMLPGWRSASFTAQGECWKPRFDLNPVIPAVIEMHSHCDLFEKQRSALSTVMSVVWVMVAAFLILRA